MVDPSSEDESASGRGARARWPYAEAFRRYFPYYLSIGMTETQYWDGPATLTKDYREAEEMRAARMNDMAWLQGLYFYEALCAAEGEESERAVSARGVLAELLFALHRYGEALEHWEGVTQQNMELYGEDDELTLEAAEYLALCLHRVGRGEEALDVCDQFGLDEDILDGRD